MDDVSTVMHACNWGNLASIMAAKKIIPGGVAQVTQAKPKGDYGPGGHKASGRTQSMFSMFARGDMRKVAGSRDNASLMAFFNPRALAEFVCDDIGMYLTPNGSSFRVGDVPLIHPTSDRPQDQPLGLMVWDLTVNAPPMESGDLRGPMKFTGPRRMVRHSQIGRSFHRQMN